MKKIILALSITCFYFVFSLADTKVKSISEGDLFVTDYIKTKQRLEKLEKTIEILQLKLDSIKSNRKVIKLFDE